MMKEKLKYIANFCLSDDKISFTNKRLIKCYEAIQKREIILSDMHDNRSHNNYELQHLDYGQKHKDYGIKMPHTDTTTIGNHTDFDFGIEHQKPSHIDQGDWINHSDFNYGGVKSPSHKDFGQKSKHTDTHNRRSHTDIPSNHTDY